MTRKKIQTCEMGSQRKPHPIEDVQKYRYTWWYGSREGMSGKITEGWLCKECAIVHRGELLEKQPNRQIKFVREKEENR